MGSCISGGGGNVIHDFWFFGKGDEGDKILKCYTFFTLSINIHLTIQWFHVFSSILSWKLRIIPYLCEIDVRTLPPLSPHKNLFNSNLVSKLVSTTAEWIVLSLDTKYYIELPQYSPKKEIENWFICPIYPWFLQYFKQRYKNIAFLSFHDGRIMYRLRC